MHVEVLGTLAKQLTTCRCTIFMTYSMVKEHKIIILSSVYSVQCASLLYKTISEKKEESPKTAKPAWRK